MMAANKVKGIRCGVCADAFSARMIRQHNDANMLSLGVRVVGEGLALDIVDAFLTARFEGGRHATRVEMIEALEGYPPVVYTERVGGAIPAPAHRPCHSVTIFAVEPIRDMIPMPGRNGVLRAGSEPSQYATANPT